MNLMKHMLWTYLNVYCKNAVRSGGMFIKGMLSNDSVHLPLLVQQEQCYLSHMCWFCNKNMNIQF